MIEFRDLVCFLEGGCQCQVNIVGFWLFVVCCLLFLVVDAAVVVMAVVQVV